MQATPHQLAQLQAMQAMQQQNQRQNISSMQNGGGGGNNIPVPSQMQQQSRAAPAMPAPPQQLSSAKRGISAVDQSTALSSADILKQHKRRKPTERTLPSSLLQHNNELAALCKEYERLLGLERSLDLTLTRRKAELGDEAASGKRTVYRTLRVRITNSCQYQEWQQEQQQQQEEQQPDFESGKGIPSWTCRIEGRLLDANGEELVTAGTSDESIPKFSHLVQHLSIDLQRPEAGSNGEVGVNLHREPALISWQPNPNTAPTSGFSFNRSSTVSTPMKISLYLSQHPKRFRLSPDLGNLLDVKEETKIGVLERLWGYIQRERLIETGEGRGIRCDERMQRLFGNAPKMQFWQICDIVTKYLGPPEPVTLSYTADVSPDCESRSVTYDILLEIPDPSSAPLHSLLRSLNSPSNPSTSQIMKHDDSISSTISSIRSLAYQYSLLSKFSVNPVGFMNDWMKSQSLDLQDLLDPDVSGNGRMKLRAAQGQWKSEAMRDSKWFSQEWVKDAVGIHIARGQQVSHRQ